MNIDYAGEGEFVDNMAKKAGLQVLFRFPGMEKRKIIEEFFAAEVFGRGLFRAHGYFAGILAGTALGRGFVPRVAGAEKYRYLRRTRRSISFFSYRWSFVPEKISLRYAEPLRKGNVSFLNITGSSWFRIFVHDLQKKKRF